MIAINYGACDLTFPKSSNSRGAWVCVWIDK
jgi:hypothetical protein